MSTLSSSVVAPHNAARPVKPVILLVEDESIVREVTRQVLEHAGYNVLECAGPKEALAAADRHRGRIALLLSDVVMPGMNGPDLAREIQQDHPGLITIFMSGYAEQDVVRKAVQESTTVYLQKPFTIDVLLTRVAEAMRRAARGGAEVSVLYVPA